MEEPRFVINRMIVLMLPKAPLVEWVNCVSRGMADPVSLDEAREHPNVFLIPALADENVESGEEWLGRNWSILFERMLEAWYADERLWPRSRSRTRALFYDWCEISIHSVVLDCSGEPIEYGRDY